MLKTNFHTHTYRCQHAQGDIADFCLAAKEAGLTALGFSDHTPLPDGRWGSVRMRMDELQDYFEKIEQAKNDFQDLTIFAGLECEYCPEFLDFFEKTLLGEYGADYLNCGIHFYPYQGQWLSSHGQIDCCEKLISYTNCLVNAIESGLFKFITHPDLFANSYLEWDDCAIECSRKIFEAAQKHSMPLELNGYGVMKPKVQSADGLRWPYPYEKFWSLANGYDIEVVINSDAHTPEGITAGMDECLAVAKKYNLKFSDMQNRIKG